MLQNQESTSPGSVGVFSPQAPGTCWHGLGTPGPPRQQILPSRLSLLWKKDGPLPRFLSLRALQVPHSAVAWQSPLKNVTLACGPASDKSPFGARPASSGGQAPAHFPAAC